MNGVSRYDDMARISAFISALNFTNFFRAIFTVYIYCFAGGENGVRRTRYPGAILAMKLFEEGC